MKVWINKAVKNFVNYFNCGKQQNCKSNPRYDVDGIEISYKEQRSKDRIEGRSHVEKMEERRKGRLEAIRAIKSLFDAQTQQLSKETLLLCEEKILSGDF